VVALGRAAATLDRDPTMMGWMLGILCEASAAKLSGDMARRQAIDDRWEAFRALVDRSGNALTADRWPLPSTWREFDPEGEMSGWRRLVE